MKKSTAKTTNATTKKRGRPVMTAEQKLAAKAQHELETKERQEAVAMLKVNTRLTDPRVWAELDHTTLDGIASALADGKAKAAKRRLAELDSERAALAKTLGQ
jgi:hypothetical protein